MATSSYNYCSLKASRYWVQSITSFPQTTSPQAQDTRKTTALLILQTTQAQDTWKTTALLFFKPLSPSQHLVVLIVLDRDFNQSRPRQHLVLLFAVDRDLNQSRPQRKQSCIYIWTLEAVRGGLPSLCSTRSCINFWILHKFLIYKCVQFNLSDRWLAINHSSIPRDHKLTEKPSTTDLVLQEIEDRFCRNHCAKRSVS